MVAYFLFILIFSLSKENKIFYLAGGYFVVMGGWWIANAALPEVDLFAGTMLKIAKKEGFSLPVNTFLYEKLKELEGASD